MRRIESFVAVSVLGLVATSVVSSLALGCGGGEGLILPPPLPDGGTTTGGGGAGGGEPVLPTGLRAKVNNRRFMTADHMLASIEMQITGEPFAELLGRNLGGYDRFSDNPGIYS